MPEFEELKIVVTLVDNASAGMQKLQDQFKSQATGSGASHVEKMKRETTNMTAMLKQVSGAATDSSKAFELLQTRMGTAGAAIGATLGVLYKATEGVAKAAIEIRNMGRAGDLMGTSFAHVKNIVEQFKAVGLNEETAIKAIGQFQNIANEARKQNFSEMFYDLQKLLHDTDIVNQFRVAMSAATTPEEKMRAQLAFEAEIAQKIRAENKNQSDDWIKEQTAIALQRARSIEGITQEFNAVKQVKDLTPAQEKFYDQLNTNAAIAAGHWESTKVNLERVLDIFKSDLLNPDSPFPKLLQWADELTKSIFDRIVAGRKELEGKSFWEKFFYISPEERALLDRLTQAVALPREGPVEGTATGGAVPFGDFGALSDADLDENNRELKRFNDNLYALLNSREGGIGYTGGALGDRSSGDNYTIAPGTTQRHPGAYTPATDPESPKPPPPPATPPAPGRSLPIDAPSSGSLYDKDPNSPMYLLDNADKLKNPPAQSLTTAAPSNPGGAFETGTPTYVKGYIAGIGDTESSFSKKDAWSEALNKPSNNTTVREIGHELGADYGYFQMNKRDAIWANKNLGMPWDQAKHLYGDGPNGQERSSKEQQSDAVHEYIKRRWPEAYNNLAKTGDWRAFRQAHGNQWFGPINNKENKMEKNMAKATEEARTAAPSVLGGTEDPAAAYRRQIDKSAIAVSTPPPIEAGGSVKVEVNPTMAGGGGRSSLFNPTPMNRQIQMDPARQGPQEPAQGSALNQ